jgi:proteasome regulatory subunit
MALDSDLDLSKVVRRLEDEDFTGAEIRSVCMEAGYLAIREDRTSITYDDFIGGIAKVKRDEEENVPITMFG